jgi:L-alanine-DL-glutamate epimerase-like enolase superfamily enzyme
MNKSRRQFAKLSATAAVLGTVRGKAALASQTSRRGLIRLVCARSQTDLVKQPVKIAAIELLKNNDQFLVRVRSTDGAEGISVAHTSVVTSTYPILLNKVFPYFIGRDARQLESHLEGVYLKDSNYKWQGLPFWVSVACAEIAVLDLLGKVAAKPIGALFGEVVRRDIPVYRASGNRGNAPEAEIEYFRKLLAETGASAIKFRLGARMRYDDDSTKRDLSMIPLTRKTFGDKMTIYADANGSYDVPMALRIGKIMEEHKLRFMEEPVPFDYYDETREIASKLDILLAGGEQESVCAGFAG